MSTRALYTFKGENASDTWNVYKHHDGYPTGAARVLQIAFDHFAWQLPRYEADECAAAFCAAGKADNYVRAALATTPEGRTASLLYASQGGGVRMMPQGPALKVASKHCSDIEYRYEIFEKSRTLRIRAYAVNAWDKPTETLLVDCPLSEFAAWAEQSEKAVAS